MSGARLSSGAGNAPRENTPTTILRTVAKATGEQRAGRPRWIWRCHSGSTSRKSSGCAATSRRRTRAGCWGWCAMP
ncbi:hypothetical protein KCP77_05505 [Salmonella enterica subsp. enterica]|nr:hypothetical protein KCP77_05505 [Salmonella enterica subsp. enterica]